MSTTQGRDYVEPAVIGDRLVVTAAGTDLSRYDKLPIKLMDGRTLEVILDDHVRERLAVKQGGKACERPCCTPAMQTALPGLEAA